MKGGGRTEGIGNFIQGGGASNSIVWVRDVGPFGSNGEKGRGDTHGVSATDHGDVSKAVLRRNMGDAGGGRRTRGSRNADGEDLHRSTTGNCGTVGGATSVIWGVCKGYRVFR